ncbi:MAG: preprotein translocase subunit SecE [Patescibacteria group bacterium]
MTTLTEKFVKKNKNPNKERFNLRRYLNNSKDELKKVAWPSKKEAWRQTWIVIAMSLGVAAFLGVWDWLFNYILEWYLKI